METKMRFLVGRDWGKSTWITGRDEENLHCSNSMVLRTFVTAESDTIGRFGHAGDRRRYSPLYLR